MKDDVEVFAFDDSRALAEGVGKKLGLEISPIDVHRFPDGESLIRAESKARKHAIVFRSLHQPNEKLLEVLFAADALRRQGADEVALIAPYLGYMRQDRVFHTGEPVSQRVVAGLLGAAFDQVMTVEAHLHRIARLSEVFPCDARSLSAAHPIARWIQKQPRGDIVIGPDSESRPWVQAIAHEAGLDSIVANKVRDSDRRVRIELAPVSNDVRCAWIVDDIASSGGTLETLVRLLKSRGVEELGAVVVHALLEDGAADRLQAAGLDHLVSTDAIADRTNAIPLSELLAQGISSMLNRKQDS